MAVFRKQGVYWIDYYVSDRRKRERIGPDKRLAETVLKKRQVAIAEGKYLDKTRVPRCTFEKLAGLYLAWARVHHQGFAPTRSRVNGLQEAFGPCQLKAITPLMVDAYLAERSTECQPASVNQEAQVLRHMFKKAIVLHTKNGERREIPMSHTLCETFQQLPRRLGLDRVFPSQGGRERVRIRWRFHRALREAGIKGFVWHDLRHTFASYLVMAGVNLTSVKELMGHKTIAMTLRYAHLASHFQRDAITRIDTYMDTGRSRHAVTG